MGWGHRLFSDFGLGHWLGFLSEQGLKLHSVVEQDHVLDGL